MPSRTASIGVPLADRVVEVISDFGDTAAPRFRFGSGCIVYAATVLTAAHVVAGAVSVEVRDTRKCAWSAFPDPEFVGDPDGHGPDLALLTIDPASGIELPPVKLAAVNRASVWGEPVTGCVAVGYPEFMERTAADGTLVRETVGAAGQVPVLSGLAGGLLSLVVSSSPRPLPAEDRELESSEWCGMSGAPLFAAGHLLGVVTEHAPRQGSSTITATPLTALEHNPDQPLWGPGVTNPVAWWARLGGSENTGVAALHRLPEHRERPQPAYTATVHAIHTRTPALLARDRELSEITTFATGQDGYQWLVGQARTGKTSLLAEAVTTTLAATGRVDTVSYFLSRREADTDSAGFLTAVIPQLAYLLDDASPAVDVHAFRHLWARAAEQAAAQGRHVLLVVDGLDEDTCPPGCPSIAALLPERAGDYAHVLVASRPDRDLLSLLPPAHPLARITPVVLEPYEGVQDSGPAERLPGELLDVFRWEPLDIPRAQQRKRVLIVDDKVGDHLARLLSDCSCTVVRSLAEFADYEPCLGDFDLALVDIHLTGSYMDHQGLEIVNRIVNAETDVLVLGMTMKPINGATRAWQRKHDLAELIQKSGDDETADFTKVIREVRAELAAGPRGQLTQLLEDFHKVIEEARTKLLAAGRDSELELLKLQARRIFDLQLDGGTLSDVRGAVRDFRVRWNVQFPLG